MKKYIYFTILVLIIALPSALSAQERPNLRQQNKEKPKISAGNPGIKMNKLRTTDPADEFSGVTAETYDKKPKKDAKKETKKTEVGAVDEADDAKKKTPVNESYSFDENPQDKEVEHVERPNRALERPGTPEEEEERVERNDIITLPSYVNPRQDDPGTESEDDILMMVGDSSLVHTYNQSRSRSVLCISYPRILYPHLSLWPPSPSFPLRLGPCHAHRGTYLCSLRRSGTLLQI